MSKFFRLYHWSRGGWGLPSRALVFLRLKLEAILLGKGAGQLLHRLGVRVYRLAEFRHLRRLGVISPQAVGIAFGIDLKPEHRHVRPVLPAMRRVNQRLDL